MAIRQVRGLPPGCEGFYPRSLERYRKSAPRLAGWLEENVPEGLTVFVLPPRVLCMRACKRTCGV